MTFFLEGKSCILFFCFYLGSFHVLFELIHLIRMFSYMSTCIPTYLVHNMSVVKIKENKKLFGYVETH